eukprot:CAMPEP_0198118846 /NCGR_PEP_ID=MMETSP1442-20131203/23290_1 /TAXON_ID= /ORGANISM="Craspedostauros australis, Strain CCMP3328" /LENGTH=281 /DNA_ID=CAMNT_0043777179 /DNA_START=94 /DNA_END=939 /DNA_ORIENTATION=+
MKILCVSLLVALLANTGAAFSFRQMKTRRSNTDLDMTTDSRREFFTKSVAAAGLGSGVLLAPTPSNAVGGMDKVNSKLRGYGLPLVAKPPNGFTPLLEVWGRGKNRFPLLVQFCHPVTWVVTTPSNDSNGEDGTVQAGEYAKGDTATFFVYEAPGHVDNLASQGKPLYQEVLQKAISQKGSNIYQDFKVTKVVPQTGPEYEGRDYVICDFKYQLLTGAGFEVDRKGVAAITSSGPAIEVLWCASTALRYKKTEEDLRFIASSFRVFSEGINFEGQLLNYDL